MPAPHQKLAESLHILKSLQDKGIVAVRSRDLTRTHRERLVESGFLQEVMKGWYIPSSPGDLPGDSTSWYTSFWNFCAVYLEERFGSNWCLYPEQSIKLHIGDMTVPIQLLVKSTKGRNRPTELLHETSVFDTRLALPGEDDIEQIGGMRVQTLSSSLVYCSPNFYRDNPVQARAALSMIADASEVLTHLLDEGKSAVAGRLAGAFRNIGRDKIAELILKAMRAAQYTVREVDPFERELSIAFGQRELSPYVNRIRLIWESMREAVIDNFPAPTQKVDDVDVYLKRVEDIYATDAYHSLSIEGYRVTLELIERVSSGAWNPDGNVEDAEHKNALAARGYWEAFQEVKQAVRAVLEGSNSGDVIGATHGDWYLGLFGPCAAVGLLAPADLAGYRNGPVYIRRSMHVPPSREAVRDMMPTLFELIRDEENAAVRVVLGHFVFVYIHPYMDGNGRIGRFLMNVTLASGGYPWAVVPVERRSEYMAALEDASVRQNIIPFASFLGSLMNGADVNNFYCV